MRNIKLIIAYDGTNYLGWQKTHTGPSIEEAVQKSLETILQESISLQAASRTDAGVHADNQVINFFIEKETLDLEKVKYRLNRVLPKDIIVKSIHEMPLTFHPTLDCKGKEYLYSICYDAVQMPHDRCYSWHYPRPLNIKNMQAAAIMMTGTHDFEAFCNSKKNGDYVDFIRTIYEISLVELPGKKLKIRVYGNNFLYKMVRNIAGSLLYIGDGRIALDTFPEIFAKRDRTLLGVTAPAHGLRLCNVLYT